MVALKRKARSQWQKIHSPESWHKYNHASNKLKYALTEYPNASFTEYITNLNRDYYTLWKPIRN
jgi:predicted cupin superfamily sugar epimerase